MEKYLFMKPLLQLISEGRFLRKIIVTALKVLAIAIGFASLVGWIGNWKFVFSLPVAGIFGGIIFQLFLVVAIYMVVHVMLLRAENIKRLPETEYTVIPITSLGLKMVGEIYASFLSVIAVAGAIYIWATGRDATVDLLGVFAPLAPAVKELSFLGGLRFLLSGLTIAFISLIIFYFLAESVIVMVDIARNIKERR